MKLNNRLVLILLVFSFLYGCGKSNDAAESSQVAAKVNGAEISVHQINQILKHTQQVTSENAPVVRKQILDRLIDEQIAIEQAEKDNIDRTPDILLAIEEAKRQLIADTYVKKLAASLVTVDDKEIRSYFDANPNLFANRKIYDLQDVVVDKNDLIKEKIYAESASPKNLQDFVGLLQSHKIRFSVTGYVKPSEELPLAMLGKLGSLNAGGVTMIDLEGYIHYLFLSNFQLAPVDFLNAKPLIKNFLFNTKAQTLVGDKMKKMREESKIEYIGEYRPQTEADKQSVISKGAAGLN